MPQAKLEEAFIYIIHKPIDFSIDFSYRLKTSLETCKSANRNLVPSPNTKNHFENKHFWHVRGKALFGHISHMRTN